MHRLFVRAAIALCLVLVPTLAAAAPQPPLPKARSTTMVGSIRVDAYGTPGKPAVVFIPGLTCGPWEFSREIRLLSPDYSVYALTLPGFDGQPPIEGPLFQTVSADFWNFLETKHVDTPVLVGHSLGGTLAIMLATQHSDRLAGIVAVDGLPILPGQDTKTPAQRSQEASRTTDMMSSIQTPAQFEAAERTYVLPYLVTAPADVAALAPLTAKSDPKASGAWLAEDVVLDLRPQLSTVTVPLVEIMPFDATLDPRSPVPFATAAAKKAYYERLLANDSTARVETIEDSRHFVMYDRPATFDAMLSKLVASMAKP